MFLAWENRLRVGSDPSSRTQAPSHRGASPLTLLPKDPRPYLPFPSFRRKPIQSAFIPKRPPRIPVNFPMRTRMNASPPRPPICSPRKTGVSTVTVPNGKRAGSVFRFIRVKRSRSAIFPFVLHFGRARNCSCFSSRGTRFRSHRLLSNRTGPASKSNAPPLPA